MKNIARMKLRWLITGSMLLALAGLSVYTAIMPKARADERSLAFMMMVKVKDLLPKNRPCAKLSLRQLSN